MCKNALNAIKIFVFNVVQAFDVNAGMATVATAVLWHNGIHAVSLFAVNARQKNVNPVIEVFVLIVPQVLDVPAGMVTIATIVLHIMPGAKTRDAIKNTAVYMVTRMNAW